MVVTAQLKPLDHSMTCNTRAKVLPVRANPPDLANMLAPSIKGGGGGIGAREKPSMQSGRALAQSADGPDRFKTPFDGECHVQEDHAQPLFGNRASSRLPNPS